MAKLDYTKTVGGLSIELEGTGDFAVTTSNGKISLTSVLDTYIKPTTGNVEISPILGTVTVSTQGDSNININSDEGDVILAPLGQGDIVLASLVGSASKIDMDARSIISLTSTFPNTTAILLEANSGGNITLDSSNAVRVTGGGFSAQTTGEIALITTASTGVQDARLISSGHTQVHGALIAELSSTTGAINVTTASGLLTTSDANVRTTSFKTTTISATGNVDTFDPTTDGVVVWELLVLDELGNNRRMSTVRAVYDDTATTVAFDFSNTGDIGDTSGITLSVTKIASGNVQLVATVTASTWTVQGSRKVIRI